MRKPKAGKFHKQRVSRGTDADISQEPAMIALVELYAEMTEDEKLRTLGYLARKIAEEEN
jgi:hypothetical protein